MTDIKLTTSKNIFKSPLSPNYQMNSKILKKKTNYQEICDAIKAAAEGPMKGIIEYNNDELVSADLRGNFNTCIFDEKAGIMLDDSFVKLIAWYDNEWGYSNKVIDLVQHVAKIDAAVMAAGDHVKTPLVADAAKEEAAHKMAQNSK